MTDQTQCGRCGHTKAAHDHHRAGTDCSGCDCKKFRRRRWWDL